VRRVECVGEYLLKKTRRSGGGEELASSLSRRLGR
jgi:hypothetical protein